MGTFKIKGDKALIAQLKKARTQVLPDLAPAVEEAAALALAHAKTLVPVGETRDLVESAYEDATTIDKRRSYVSKAVGFSSSHAAYVHEGYHWGKKRTPPKFLKKGAKKARSKFRKALLSRLKASLARLFPEKSK